MTIYETAFDYDALKRRLAADSTRKQDVAKARDLLESTERRRLRTKVKPDAPKKIARIAAFVQSESTHFAFASVILAAFVIWIGHMFYGQYVDRIENAFARKCSSNYLNHASNIICYDGHGYIHMLNPDGTAKKAALDWTINEHLLRQTEFVNSRPNTQQVD